MKLKNYLLFFLISILWISCKNAVNIPIEPHNANQPIVLTDFSPQLGSAATKLIITGENFGNDTSQVTVNIGGKKAAIVGISPTKIYVLSPRRLEPINTIEVTIKGQSKSFEKKYNYKLLQTVSTLSGRVNADGSGGDVDGALGTAMFKDPKYLNIDGEKNLFVIQYADSRNIRMVNITNNKVTTIPAGAVKSAHGIVIRKVDNVPFVCDRDGFPKTFFQLSPANSWQPTLSFNDAANEYSYPLDIAYDETANIFYLQDYTFGKILAVDGRTFTSLGEVYRTNVNEIDRIAVDHEGNIYIARTSSHYIVKFNPKTGQAETYAGGQGIAGTQDGPKMHARFNNPEQMVFDEENNMYVADRGNHCIRKIDKDGNVTVYAGQPGKGGYSDGLPQNALFNQPTGLALDKEGILYVADWKNHRIRTIIIE